MPKVVQMQFDARTEQAERSMRLLLERMLASERAMTALTTQTGRALQAVEQMGQATARQARATDGMGQSLAAMSRHLTGFVTLGSALAAMAANTAQMRNEFQQAANALERIEQTRRALLQISETPEEFQRLTLVGRQVALSAGVPRDVAERLAFTAQSAGIADQAARIAEASVGLGVAPEEALRSIITLREAFGREVAGTETQIFNRLFAAAGRTKLGVTEISRAAAIPAPAARLAGAGIDETLALVAAMIDPETSPERAAEQVKRVARAVRELGRTSRGAALGVGRTGVVAGLEQAARDPELARELEALRSGSSEVDQALAAYEAAAGRVVEFQRAIAASIEPGGGQIERGLAIAAADPALQALLETRRARVARDIRREEALGPAGLAAEEAEQERKDAQRERELAVARYAEEHPVRGAVAEAMIAFQDAMIGAFMGLAGRLASPERAARWNRQIAEQVRDNAVLGRIEGASPEAMLEETNRLLAQIARNTQGTPELAPRGTPGNNDREAEWRMRGSPLPRE